MSAPPIFATLGCRLNAYETEAMKDLAAAAGVEGAVVVNTCAVTAEAVRKAKQEIRRLARENPGAPVIVTGCAAQTDPETFAAMPEVTRVIGNHEKMQAATWARIKAASSLSAPGPAAGRTARKALIWRCGAPAGKRKTTPLMLRARSWTRRPG